MPPRLIGTDSVDPWLPPIVKSKAVQAQIDDVANLFVSTDVEGALAELASAPGGAPPYATDIETIAGVVTDKAVTPAGRAAAAADVDVRAHGAVGDGVTDDAPAVRAAAALAQTSSRGLFFPAGRYLFKTLAPTDQSFVPITTGLHIHGVAGKSVLLMDPLISGWRTVFGSIPWQAFDLSGFTVENLVFDATGNVVTAANAGSQRYAISAYKGYDMRVRNCLFRNWDSRNLICFISNNVTLTDVVGDIHIHDNTFTGIGGTYWHDHSTIFAAGPDTHIYGNSFEGIPTPASSAWTAVELHGHRAHVHDNTFANYNSPCLIAPNSPAIPEAPPSHFHYHDNTVVNCGTGVTLRPLYDLGDIHIHDNEITIGIDQTPSAPALPYPGNAMRAGVTMYGQSSRISRMRIHDNTVRWLSHTTPAAPLDSFIAWTRPQRIATSPDTDIAIVDNDIIDCPSAGLNLEHFNQLNGWDVSRNRFTNVGKAALGVDLQAGMLLGFQTWTTGARPVGVQDFRFNGNKFVDTQTPHTLSTLITSPAGAVTTHTGCSTDGTTTVVDPAAIVHDIGSLISGPNIAPGSKINQITASPDGGYTGTGYILDKLTTGTGTALTFTLTKQPPTTLNVEMFDTTVRLADGAALPWSTLQPGQLIRTSDRPYVVHKTTDQTSSDNVNLADVTEMAFPVAAGATYMIEFYLLATAAVATTGLGMAINGPAAPVYVRYTYHSGVSGSATNQGGATALNVALVGTAASTVNPLPTTLNGYLVNGPNAGVVQLRMRSEVAAEPVTIQRGSWGRLTRIA